MKTLHNIICLYLLLLSGCQYFVFVSHTEVSATDEIREKAFFAAEYYADANIEYELGGTDTTYVPTYGSRGLDCSGLVNNVYNYAIQGTNYSLGYVDATADQIYKNYSETLNYPQKGDLMIWTDDSDHAFHIAIFEKIENGYYHFIESNDPDLLESKTGTDGTFRRTLSVTNSYDFTISLRRMKLIEIK